MKQKVNLEKVACEAALLLNEAIRELLLPQHLNELADKWLEQGHLTERYAAAITRMAIMSVVVNINRVKETRDHFLEGWLFTDNELRDFGFLPIEEFVGDWKSFLIVRGQIAAHVRSKKVRAKREAGQIPPAAVVGKALRKTGLWERDNFLRRIREELVPAIERVRDQLFKKYPNSRHFIEVTYPSELMPQQKSHHSHRLDSTYLTKHG